MKLLTGERVRFISEKTNRNSLHELVPVVVLSETVQPLSRLRVAQMVAGEQHGVSTCAE